MQQFKYSDAGLALTKRFEGLRLQAYKDSAGICTIGYGHTGADIHMGRCIGEFEADELLRVDLQDAVDCVNRLLEKTIQQHQFDALVDFCYNAGRGSFERSSLLTKVNQMDFEGAAMQFGLWVNVNMRPIPGLARRRTAEAAMFRGSPAG
ncbi:MAG: lysozyme [Janthinobacterium lividum]